VTSVDQRPGVPLLHAARGVRLLATLLLLSALPYVLFVVVAYFVNDLDRFPLEEVAAGYHDPKDMWPTTVPHIGGWLHTLGVLSLAAVPLVSAGALVISAWSVVSLVRSRSRAWGVVLGHLAVVVACVATTAYFLSPVSQQLAGWQMD
jgi:hypothetical protein